MRTSLRAYLKAVTLVEILPLKEIVASPIPLREDLGNVMELVRSIRRRGVLEPIIVRPRKSKFEIIAGHRRYTASRLAGFHEIPVIITDASDKEAYEISLEENVHRKTLDPIEEARAFKFYVTKYGYGSISALADRIGKSQEYVSQRLALLSLSDPVQAMVMRRLMSPNDAWEISRVKDKKAEFELAQAMLSQNLTVRELRRAANLVKRGLSVDAALGKVRREDDPASFLDGLDQQRKSKKELRIRKATAMILRASLIRIDNVIEGLDDGDGHTELKAELMKTRYSMHQLIDDFVGADRDKDTDEIVRLLNEKFLKSINDRDLSAFTDTWTPNFSMFDDFPPLRLMDMRSAREHNKRVFKAIRGSQSEITDLKIEVFGSGALATFKFNYDMTIGKFQLLAASRVSVVVVKLQDTWKILHQHWSQIGYEYSMIDKLKQVQKGYEPLQTNVVA